MFGTVARAAVSMILVAGCAATTEPAPRLMLRLPGGVPGTPTVLTIVDEAGVVRGARVTERDIDPGPGPWAGPFGPSTVQFEWLGGMCEAQPRLTLRLRNDELHLELDHGPSPEQCAAAGVPYGVVLDLDPDFRMSSLEPAETWPPTSPE